MNLYEVKYMYLTKSNTTYITAKSYAQVESLVNKNITNISYILSIKLLAKEGLFGTPTRLILK